ncbi:hypothetical protein IOC57_25175 [Bacillus sp. SD075]|uniref:hypothetical protein n=1 Tax=Bacillus sp. SD075 TaxID=2781732 RepID=UPI001A96EEF0|nr:hypothetical protein [Bacillus sp. SD075]MBO1001004.1 hypothetical protein [Bacillus sp. SD075]
MKVVIQAFMGSIAIHIVYIAGLILVSYIKTRNYKPDIVNAWDKVETLQNEVVFGKVNSPFLYVFTFMGVTLIYGVIILLYKKWLN